MSFVKRLPPCATTAKPPIQHVTSACVVQGATDADEVFRLGCACVRSIISLIHAAASSKLENR